MFFNVDFLQDDGNKQNNNMIVVVVYPILFSRLFSMVQSHAS